MITVVIKGGLGNQLFQYASAFSLAKRLNQPLALDISFFPSQTLRGYKLDKLAIDPKVVLNPDISPGMKLFKNRYINQLVRRSKNLKRIHIGNKTTYLVELAGSFVPEFFEIEAENIFMNGYFQCEDYFRDCRAEILGAFTPTYDPEEEYIRTQELIRNSNSVAVHVRHGDFAKGDRTIYHYILGEDYYTDAIKEMRRKVNNPQFYCFSDDIEWVTQNIGGTDDFHFVSLKTSHADIDEMMLMKNCNHIITANSTFSWWAAWLNEHKDAIRIVPKRPYGPDKLIPADWIKM